MLFPAVPAALATALASSYVAAIHIGVPASLAGKDRDRPDVIRYRIGRVSALCLAIVLLLPPLLAWSHAYASVGAAARQLGLVPGFTNARSFAVDVQNILLSCVKIGVLYMGPLAHAAATSDNWTEDVLLQFTTLHGVRDHLFAPITEELVYRGALIAVLAPYAAPHDVALYLPLLFGLAHVHHGYQLRRDGVPVAEVALRVLFQFLYTAVFGVLANRVYLSTQCNLWCPIVVHQACNMLGFPSLDMRHTHPRWFYVYCGMLVAGVVSFVRII